MKYCYKCKSKKPKTDFYSNKYRSDGLQSICKVCSSKRRKEYYQNEDKQARLAKARLRRDKNSQRVINYLKSNPCVDCGEDDPIVLEFDHMSDKKFSISNSLDHGWKSIKEEIKKCKVRCANCHRRKTAKQLNWYKNVVM